MVLKIHPFIITRLQFVNKFNYDSKYVYTYVFGIDERTQTAIKQNLIKKRFVLQKRKVVDIIRGKST